MDEIKCRICGNEQYHNWYKIPEMRFGMNESFSYYKCGSCGCLQIRDYPSNISDYYPSDYYSYDSELLIGKSGLVKSFVLGLISNQCTQAKRTLAGRLFYQLLGGGSVEKIKGSKATFQNKILEIGSGTGNTLVRLHKYGFRNLWGIDPFIEKDIYYNDQVRVLKTSVTELEEKDFDLIFLNHSFEHMPDQSGVLKEIARISREGTYVMIAVPVVDTYPWRRYGINYVGLDAPRHFYLHTVNSIRILAEKNGFMVEDYEFQSNAFHLWASEQYAMGIPLQHKNSFYMQRDSEIFSKKAIHQFEKFSKANQMARDGGNALFYLKKMVQADV